MGAYAMQKGSLFMRISRRLVVPLSVFALVAAGGVALGLTQVANAQPATDCLASATAAGPVNCVTNTVTITDPTSITLVVTLTTGDGASPADQEIVVTWQGDCYQGSTDDEISSGTTTPAPVAITTAAAVSVPVSFPAGMPNPDGCNIQAAAELETTSGTTPTNTVGAFELDVDDVATSPSASTTTTTASSSSSVDVPYVSGYGGKCIDDRGNSSSDGAQVIIWGCNHGDSAQDWTWSGYELKHDGMCVNDPGYGGSGTKLILYSCTGSSNEKWSHVSYGEFKLYYSAKGQLCLDDPAYSTSNGTRLTVYKCNNGSNQHWSRS
jgi:hypothetical protein